MSKRKCYRCRLPIPNRASTAACPAHDWKQKRREGPWELIEGSGKWWCLPCILIRICDAEVAEANRTLDAAMSEHLRHENAGRFAGCPICAVEV